MSYKISLSSVKIPESTYVLIEKTLRAGRIGQGVYVKRFEEMICEYVGSKYCIAVSNGTMADAVALAAVKEQLGIKKVMVPALTFIAQPNSARYNELEVEFCDVYGDWKAKYPVHFDDDLDDCPDDTMLFLTDIMGRVIDRPGIWIEDACEAFGSKKNGKHAGTFGLMGTYSFFPSHTISTGEGGAIVTNDSGLATLCRSIRAHGFSDMNPFNKFSFQYFGFNARMTDLQAALGIALMEEVDEHVGARRHIFSLMQDKIGGFEEKAGEELVPHGFPIEFKDKGSRNKGMMAFLDAEIECRLFFSCIPRDEKPYQKKYISHRRYPMAEHIADTHLYLPCTQLMSAEDVDYMAKIFDSIKGLVR